MMVTNSIAPISPLNKRSCKSVKLGSKRRLKAVKNGTPVSSMTFMHSRMRFEDKSTGFSQNMALPALAAAWIRSKVRVCWCGYNHGIYICACDNRGGIHD